MTKYCFGASGNTGEVAILANICSLTGKMIRETICAQFAHLRTLHEAALLIIFRQHVWANVQHTHTHGIADMKLNVGSHFPRRRQLEHIIVASLSSLQLDTVEAEM